MSNPGGAIAKALISGPDAGLAPIVANAVYPLEVFKRYTGLEKASIRKMRGQGFSVRKIGKRHFVIGSDFLAWYETAPMVSA